MNVPFFDLNSQYQSIKPEIDHSIRKVFEEGTFIGGAPVAELEKILSSEYGINHCTAVGSGAQGLEIVLRALGIGKGDEVITTAYSWVATAHAISMVGATPVFCDIELSSFNLDSKRIEPLITPNTRAILPVHLYGRMADMEKIHRMGEKYRLYVIEDAAQAHFSTYNDISPGKKSHAAVFSFYPTKQLGAYGDAGAILTNDEKLADACRRMAHHGADFPKRDYQMAGTNSRIDTLQAKILTVKMRHLEDWIHKRAAIASVYYSELAHISSLILPERTNGHSWYLFSIMTGDRPRFLKFLDEKNIGYGVNYEYTLPQIAPYVEDKKYSHAEIAAKSVVNLPCYPELTKKQLLYVCEKIKEYFA